MIVMETYKTFSIRVPANVAHALVSRAMSDGCSINAFFLRLAEAELGLPHSEPARVGRPAKQHQRDKTNNDRE